MTLSPFGSPSDIVKRRFALTLTKLHFYVDYAVVFAGKHYNRLHINTKLKHIPIKQRKYQQYLYNTNAARATLLS